MPTGHNTLGGTYISLAGWWRHVAALRQHAQQTIHRCIRVERLRIFSITNASVDNETISRRLCMRIARLWDRAPLCRKSACVLPAGWLVQPGVSGAQSELSSKSCNSNLLLVILLFFCGFFVFVVFRFAFLGCTCTWIDVPQYFSTTLSSRFRLLVFYITLRYIIHNCVSLLDKRPQTHDAIRWCVIFRFLHFVSHGILPLWRVSRLRPFCCFCFCFLCIHIMLVDAFVVVYKYRIISYHKEK